MNTVSYKWHGKLTPWLFIFPTLIGLIIFRCIPIISAFCLSFTDWNLLSAPVFSGIANYKELFCDPSFWRIVLNTFQFSAIFVCGGMVCGLALAVLINVTLHGISFLRALIYLPVVTSSVAVGIIWNWMLGPNFGIISQAITAPAGSALRQ